jgi:hypothetical protein
MEHELLNGEFPVRARSGKERHQSPARGDRIMRRCRRASLEACVVLLLIIPRCHLAAMHIVRQHLGNAHTVSSKRILEVSCDETSNEQGQDGTDNLSGLVPIEIAIRIVNQANPLIVSSRVVLPNLPIRRVPANFWRPPPRASDPA